MMLVVKKDLVWRRFDDSDVGRRYTQYNSEFTQLIFKVVVIVIFTSLYSNFKKILKLAKLYIFIVV